MQAELDYVNGQPVLRMEKLNGSDWGGQKRTVMDLPLTPEQVRTVKLMEL